MNEQDMLCLVQRLRHYYSTDEDRWEIAHPICDEAADAIEALLEWCRPDPELAETIEANNLRIEANARLLAETVAEATRKR